MDTASPVVVHLGTVARVSHAGRPSARPSAAATVNPPGTATATATATAAKFASSARRCAFTRNANPSTAGGTKYRSTRPAPSQYSRIPPIAPAPVAAPTPAETSAIATPPVMVGKRPTRWSLAGTRVDARYVATVAARYDGANATEKETSRGANRETAAPAAARIAAAATQSASGGGGGFFSSAARASAASPAFPGPRADSSFAPRAEDPPVASSFDLPDSSSSTVKACATWPAMHMVARYPAAHATAAAHRCAPAGRLLAGTAVMYGMKTQAIFASTARTAGSSAEVSARSTPRGAKSSASVRPTRPTTSGAEATPAAAHASVTARRYASRSARPRATRASEARRCAGEVGGGGGRDADADVEEAEARRKASPRRRRGVGPTGGRSRRRRGGGAARRRGRVRADGTDARAKGRRATAAGRRGPRVGQGDAPNPAAAENGERSVAIGRRPRARRCEGAPRKSWRPGCDRCPVVCHHAAVRPG